MAQVFPYLGWQVFNENGDPAPGAKARFFLAGTSTPVNVYSNSTLVTPHAVPVVADSEGRFPTIYAASGVYKVKVTNSADVDLFPEVDQLTILTDLTQTQLSFPTATKTANYTVVAADRGKVLEFDAAGGTLIVTLKAATLGAGFPIWIVNSGATGTVQLEFDPGETLLDAATYQLVVKHQSVGITSRGAAGWRMFTQTGNIPLLSVANTFTADITIQSTDTGAGEAPDLHIDRFSGSPAAADILGGVEFLGRSTTAVSRAYARIRAVAKTVTNAAEDGLLAFRTMLAGTEADRVIIGAGLYMAGATGGDKGVNTINATQYYKDGALFPVAAWNHLETLNPSGVASIQNTVSFAGYNLIRITFYGITPVTNSSNLRFQPGTDSSTFADWDLGTGVTSNSSAITQTGNNNLLYLNPGVASNVASNGGISGQIMLYNFNTAERASAEYSSAHHDAANFQRASGMVCATGTTARTHIRFLFSAGNIATGRIVIEGIA